MRKDHIFLAIFIVSLIASAILTQDASIICDPNKGCDVVQSSSYAYTFGIKNSTYGVIFFKINKYV